MISNLETFKTDLDNLIKDGLLLHKALQKEHYPDQFKKIFKKQLGKDYDLFIKKLPVFADKYQDWYSESIILITRILPDRINDFRKIYEKPKTTRKNITYENYTLEDQLHGLSITSTSYGEERHIVGPEAGVTLFYNQYMILQSTERKFESSLFNIKQLIQSDLFDNELASAEELCKKGFLRGAGAICGVVLETHLSDVCTNHDIKISKKHLTISDYNDKLKEHDIYEVPTWRKIQHLGDLRNLCDHKKKREPNKEDIGELIEGVAKIIKNIF